MWNLIKGQMKELNRILKYILKRILKVAPGTPGGAFYIRTVLLDLEKKQSKETELI